jgi:hypothetical protein
MAQTLHHIIERRGDPIGEFDEHILAVLVAFSYGAFDNPFLLIPSDLEPPRKRFRTLRLNVNVSFKNRTRLVFSQITTAYHLGDSRSGAEIHSQSDQRLIRGANLIEEF